MKNGLALAAFVDDDAAALGAEGAAGDRNGLALLCQIDGCCCCEACACPSTGAVRARAFIFGDRGRADLLLLGSELRRQLLMPTTARADPLATSLPQAAAPFATRPLTLCDLSNL